MLRVSKKNSWYPVQDGCRREDDDGQNQPRLKDHGNEKIHGGKVSLVDVNGAKAASTDNYISLPSVRPYLYSYVRLSDTTVSSPSLYCSSKLLLK